jgi:hypothetical protein
MKVIGAGFGRTGTHSLKLALEQLGFAPCYHMTEVFAHPEHVPLWDRAAHGEPTDWRSLLAPYPAGVDWPICNFWRELSQVFPDAKFILTERAPEAWYKSISQTIFPLLQRDAPPGPMGDTLRMNRHLIGENVFGGDYSKDNVIAAYERHNARVKASLPAERLLIWDSPQGWEPLCAFLGVPVPATPFPKTNSTEEFRARAQL